MSLILGLEYAYGDVCSRMSEEYTNLIHAFGWREPAKNQGGGNAPKAIWVAGDPSGDIGEILPPAITSRMSPTGKPLHTLNENFTIYLTNYGLEPRNELAQWRATRQLFDCFVRSIYHSSRPVQGKPGYIYQLSSVTWLTDKIESTHGCTARVVGYLSSTIGDLPPASVYPVTADVSYNLSINPP